MNNILIGTLSAWKYPDRRDRCASTWMPEAKRLGADAVFLMGAPKVGRPQRYGDLLALPCPDDYPSLPQRTRWFCRWALDQPGWDYLFKCDDDTYVAADRLVSYNTAGCDYIGAEWKAGVGYGSGGGGYLLSRKAAAIVAERLTMATGAEDLLVGKVLRKAGIHFSIEPRFVPCGNADHRPTVDNNLITVHGVGADVFRRSHADIFSPQHSSPPQKEYLFKFAS